MDIESIVEKRAEIANCKLPAEFLNNRQAWNQFLDACSPRPKRTRKLMKLFNSDVYGFQMSLCCPSAKWHSLC
jgi:hypothetical protein